MKTVKDRFLDYVSFDTESMEGTDKVPSTDKQLVLAEHLVKELKEMGIEDARILPHGYVFGTIPATTEKDLPVLGFVSHMDTSPQMTGKDVKPREIHDYDGEDIVLNKELDIVMKVKDFPFLPDFKGQHLIVTDGTTLLGADDKAGIAEIMQMAAFFTAHPEIPHGEIKIGFTPDEEVGNGTAYFDVEEFGADYAYTVDGGILGEIECENFNAASAKLTVNGVSIHPGYAKWKMKDAIKIAMEFQSLMPAYEDPYCTEGYEGFIHVVNIEGNTEKTVADYIIRDHDREKFEKKKEFFLKAVEFINAKYGEKTAEVEMKDSYYNMKEMIEPNMHLVENAKRAMEELGIPPLICPIRGGTDGASLSYMGLPCPNLCTGGMNYHGKYEFVSVDAMNRVVELLKKLVLIYAE